MKEKDQVINKKKTKKDIAIAVVLIIAAIVIFVFPNRAKETETINLSEYSSVNKICELATLKSFYHNVVMYEKEPDGGSKFVNDVLFWPFGGKTKVGYKQFWLEYSGIIKTGIDASKIKISEPDSNGVVEVFVPEAKVLNVDADEDSLSNPVSEKGLFTNISGEEKIEAFSSAQSVMRKEAEEDQSLLQRSRENAKVLLEQYIINTGKSMNMDLSVRWIETS